MELQHLQHTVDLLATSDPKSLKGNENTINAARNLLSVTGEIEKFANEMSSRGIKVTSELFNAWDHLYKKSEEGEDES